MVRMSFGNRHSLADLGSEHYDLLIVGGGINGAGIARDRETITCLRSVLMKPEHREWLDRIWSILDASAGAAR